MNTFTCFVCGNTYEKEWTDEEAKEELEHEFAGVTTDDCEIVCDDCYKQMFGEEDD